ncbi:MAG: putative zinc-binding protein [Methanomassiliicoccales archaeon]|nr:putative zinc-binding protein [Methanomassiliicoccales archaeon]
MSSLEGVGRMACLPGLATMMDTSLKAAGTARKIVVVDGCSMLCGKKIVEASGHRVDEQVVITELGVVKCMDLHLRLEDLEKVKAAIKAKVT